MSAIQSQDPFGQAAGGVLDSITLIIPEPSVTWLLVTAIGLLVVRSRWKR